MSRTTLEFWRDRFPSLDHFGHLVGYRFVAGDVDRGLVEMDLVIEERHISPSGAVHGGVLSTLVDTAMGGAVFTRLQEGQLCSTIELKLNYLAPVRQGETLIAIASVIHLGRSHATTEAELRVGERKVAKALGTYNLYRPRFGQPPSEE